MNQNEQISVDFFIGIDMSKAKFDAGVMDVSGKRIMHKIFNNNDLGFINFLNWLHENLNSNALFFCMEYTGIYSRKLWMFLQDHDCKLWMESGFQIKRKSGIFKTKNDKMDAYRIAEYALYSQYNLKITADYDENMFILHDLLANRDRIKDCISRLQVPLNEIQKHGSKASFDALKDANEAALKSLQESLKMLENEMDLLIAKNTHWQKNIELATSIPGVGKIVTLWLLVYSKNFSSEFNARKMASLSGIAPFEISSGTSINGGFHVNCYSHKQLKGLLHIVAMTAIRHNPNIKLYFEKKKKEGKKGFVPLNNVKNKIIQQIYAVIRSEIPFDKNYKHPKAA